MLPEVNTRAINRGQAHVHEMQNFVEHLVKEGRNSQQGYCSGELGNGSLDICEALGQFKGDLTFRLETLQAAST